jgi:hypothetical protein
LEQGDQMFLVKKLAQNVAHHFLLEIDTKRFQLKKTSSLTYLQSIKGHMIDSNQWWSSISGEFF